MIYNHRLYTTITDSVFYLFFLLNIVISLEDYILKTFNFIELSVIIEESKDKINIWCIILENIVINLHLKNGEFSHNIVTYLIRIILQKNRLNYFT